MICPRRAVQPCAHGLGHQCVVARVKLHLVDTPAEAVMRVQLGRVHIGQPGMGLHPGRAQRGAQLRER